LQRLDLLEHPRRAQPVEDGLGHRIVHVKDRDGLAPAVAPPSVKLAMFTPFSPMVCPASR
jgi:hypothetical protein